MNSKNIPIVRGHLSKSFAQLIANSTHVFDINRLRAIGDRGLYVIEGLSKLVYDDADATFITPEGCYIWISVAAGQVMELIAGATERALPLDEAYERASHIDQILSALPFERSKPMHLKLADILWEMGQITSDGYEIPLARYWLRDIQWTLRLTWVGPRALTQREAYILSMRWSSESVEDELLAKVHEKRVAHGDESQALPLSMWMEIP